MTLYERFIKPKSTIEDTRRREFIFNVLLLGLMTLTLVAFLIALVRFLRPGANLADSSPFLFLPPLVILSGLYAVSRRRFNNVIVYIFLGLYLALGTYALFQYGYVLPSGLLTYVLVIIMTGILISATASIFMTGLIMISLCALAFVQIGQLSHPYLDELDDPLNPVDLLVFLFIFAVIVLVTWLSNREIERSLVRARASEKALRKERNLLEVKVKERTRELEEAQAERMLELHRFAEFGRLYSTLLHDLADPLTATKLSLQQAPSHKKYASLLNQIGSGLEQIEQYVVGARRQLQKQREVKEFDVAAEIQHVVSLHESKARNKQIVFEQNLAPGLLLYGDGIQFHHIVSNLLSNSIDAYDDQIKARRKVKIITQKRGKTLVLTVQDNGHGISNKNLPKIFDAFYTTKRDGRGTGIGLVITKQAVVNEFHGTIEVKSRPSSGSTFRVVLPLS